MDKLKDIKNKGTSSKGLGNNGILRKEAVKYNPETKNFDPKPKAYSVVGMKAVSPPANLIKLNSAHEEIEGKPNNSNNEARSAPLKNAANNKLNLEKSRTKEFWLTEAPGNGTSPSTSGAGHKIYKLTQIRSSSLDHNYSRVGKTDFLPRKIKVQKSTCLKEQSGNTVRFQNGSILSQKRMEQQTIGVRSLIKTNLAGPSSDLSKNNLVKVGLQGKTVSQNNINSPSASNVNINKNPGTFLTPKIRIRKSDGSGDYYDVIVQDNASKPQPFVAAKSEFGEIKQSDNKLEYQKPGAKAEQKPVPIKRATGFNNIAGGVLGMADIGEPEIIAVPSSSGNSEIPPVKIRKMSGKEYVSQSQNEGGFVLSEANLTKTAPGDKNWNLEYTEDDAKNLGLDDLLLKASELNAENFTKALGQSSSGRSGNKIDSPDIVLSFPTAKRASDGLPEGDNPNGGNAKKAKLEIVKKCVRDDKFIKSIEEDSSKKAPELPKKPSLKVKTVQNINEEFKDALGAKMKMMEGLGVAPESSIPVYTINDDGRECNQANEVFIQGKAPEKLPTFLSYPQLSKQQYPTKYVNGISTETRPFIMKVMPNKENQAKNQMPATLTPKVFPNSRSILLNRSTFLPPIEGQPGAAANNKIPGGRDPSCKSNDNATYAVTEPKPFEVVNVSGYPDPGAKKTGMNSQFVVNNGSSTKKDSGGKNIAPATSNSVAGTKNTPIVLSTSKQFVKVPLVNGQKVLISPAAEKIINSASNPQNKLVNSSPEKAQASPRENNAKGMPGFTISSVEQKIGDILKDAKPAMGGGSSVQVKQNVGDITKNARPAMGGGSSVPVKQNVGDVNKDARPATGGGSSVQVKENVGDVNKDARPATGGGSSVQVKQNVVSPQAAPIQVNNSGSRLDMPIFPEEEIDDPPEENPQLMNLPAFAKMLQDILPETWILSMDNKFGLQLLKTHLDDYLNPAIMMSVVVGSTGIVTVNVRGRQLENCHEVFDNLCDNATNKGKININYVLALMNRLKYYVVCFGCDDLSLKKYWCEDGFIEYYTEYQQTYRSHICESLIKTGRKRCHPCYRMFESLKKRKKRELIAEMSGKSPKPKPAGNTATIKYSMTHNSQESGMRRTWEDYMDEALFYMRRNLMSELQRIREEEEESENAPRTQDEVLGSMGLARVESLDVNNVRKSRRVVNRRDNAFAANSNRDELLFLEKYWREIYILFATSLLVGGYSRLSTEILKAKCKKFYNLLFTWRQIVIEDPAGVGGDFGLAENLVHDGQAVTSDFVRRKFDRMDDAALRSYLINSVKELNRMKLKLRTKNRSFMALFNTHMKPVIRKAKRSSEAAAAKNAAAKRKRAQERAARAARASAASTSTEAGSSSSNN